LYLGKLSLRRLSVLVSYLPPGSAIWAVQSDVTFGWSLTDLLITDLWHATTGEPHPHRPTGKEKSRANRANELAERLLAQRERLGNQNIEKTGD
jgi:hypothetical protein